MSTSSMRRFGALMVDILLLSAVLVPAAGAAPVSSSAASSSQGATSCTVYHRVVRGDNLTRIAYRYGVTVAQLQRWNNIWNPDRIYVGQTLVIYRACPPPKPQPQPQPHPGPHPGPYPGPQPGPYPGPQPGPQPPHGAWTATYYNSMDLTGPVVLHRMEGRPCYNWGWGSPAPQVAPDYFSARWTTVSNAVGGTYRVSVRTDDGVRVYVDGMLVLNEWREQSVRGYFVDLWIAPGWHTWTIEFFEQAGVAELCFSATKL